MRIRSVEEIATGVDEVIGEIFRKRRDRFGASIEEVARATGAAVPELQLLESGDVGAFADIERLRLVILAYCDHLDLDAAPLLARLEIYAPRQKLVIQHWRAGEAPAPPQPSRAGPYLAGAFFAALFLAGVAALYLARTGGP